MAERKRRHGGTSLLLLPGTIPEEDDGAFEARALGGLWLGTVLGRVARKATLEIYRWRSVGGTAKHSRNQFPSNV
jgi:hypothetical protein